MLDISARVYRESPDRGTIRGMGRYAGRAEAEWLRSRRGLG
jgi:hypothetical protein